MLLALAVSGSAAPAQGKAGCSALADIMTGARLAHLDSKGSQPLLKGAGANCPADTPQCRLKATASAKDVLITSGDAGAFTCVALPVAKTGAVTIGYVPTARLTFVPSGPADDKGWLGKWTAPEKTIRIRDGQGATGALRIEGDATYGTLDPNIEKKGGVHTGNFTVDAVPAGNMLRFGSDSVATIPFDPASDKDCMVQIARAGAYLVVTDNKACGGANVTFSGIYKRN